MTALAVGAVSLAVSVAAADPWPSIPIPPENPRSGRPVPARPPPGDVADRARLLVTALRTGADEDITRAVGFFLPRDPFLAIKDMSGAAGYFDTLIRWYRRDVAAYRAELTHPERAEFVRFDLSRACTWMTAGREANRLPYWSCYRSQLVLRVDGHERSLPVHVVIHWGPRWYVTHLRPRPQ